MDNILNQLYTPLLSTLGFYETKAPKHFKQSGLYYQLHSKLGTGYYWIYPVEDLYAITAYDFTFKEDLSLDYKYPSFSNIGSYGAPIAKLIDQAGHYKEDSLIGYVDDAQRYQQEIQKETSIKSVGISFTPLFNEKVFKEKFNHKGPPIEDILYKIKGDNNLPEVNYSLKQILAARPSPSTAKMYYEGKLFEITALMLQWDEHQKMYPQEAHLPQWQQDTLNDIYHYLCEHYHQTLSLKDLSHRACMSQNKLTGAFKHTYGTTITEQIQILRIEKAKEMLIHSDWSISEVAKAVGYQRHASFSVIFKRLTGLTPNAFRRQF